jgi:hypothetical protein
MAAIEEILQDCYDGHINAKMAIQYISAITHEWVQ